MVSAPTVFSKSRIEAFSDGVIAVAITLLVLDLRVPPPGDPGTLVQGLLELWPNYVAFVISFIAIGIMWINHHTMLRRLARVDHSVLMLNLLLLLCIVELPFATSLLATYLTSPDEGWLAAVVYAASFLLTSLVFGALQFHLLRRRPHLLHTPLSLAQTRAVLVRAAIAPPAYLLAGALGLASPYLTLAACAALGGFYVSTAGLRVPAVRDSDVPSPAAQRVGRSDQRHR